MTTKLVTWLTVLCLLCLTAVAQSPVQVGLAGAVDQHQYDGVDLMTNTPMINAPVMHKPGLIPLDFKVRGNSFLWPNNNIWQAALVFNCIGVGGAGSSNTCGGLVGSADDRIALGAAVFGWYSFQGTVSCGGNNVTKYSNFYIQTGDGIQHPLVGGTQMYVLAGTGACNTTQTWQTGDGSGFQAVVTGNPLDVTITDRTGTTYANGHMTDRNGNKIANDVQSCGTSTCSITDSMGLTALTGTLSTPMSGVDDITYQWNDVNNGTPQSVTTYNTYTLQTTFNCPGITDYPGTTSWLLPASHSLGDGRSLGIQYEGTSGHTGHYTGRILTLTLPTSGTVTYNYGGMDCNFQTPDLLTRSLGNGDKTTYTITRTVGTESSVENAVVDQGGNETDYYFSGFTNINGGSHGAFAWPVAQLLVGVQRFSGHGSGKSLISTDSYCYNGDNSCPSSLYNTPTTYNYPISRRMVSHALCISGCTGASPTMTGTSMIVTYYDTGNMGTIVQQDSYDFGGSTIGGSNLVRSTVITYGTCTASCTTSTPTIGAIGSGIVDKPGQIISYQYSGGTAYGIFYENFIYDSHGNKLWSNVSPDGGTTFIGQFTHNTYNSNGTVLKSYDMNNNETDYTYSLSGYLSCSACTTALLPWPTQVTNFSTGNYLKYTYYGIGGVVASITDRNGAVITDAYAPTSGTADPFWRIMSSTNPLLTVTNYTYPTSTTNSSSVSTEFNSSTSISGMISTPDAYDRNVNSQIYQSPTGSNYDTVSSQYSWTNTTNGLIETDTSQPCSLALGSLCTSFPHTTKVDPLGRVTASSTTSNETITHVYSGNDDTTTLGPAPSGENAKETITEVDGLGRVTHICRAGNGVSTSCSLASGSVTGDDQTFAYGAGASGQTTVTVTRGSQVRKTTFDGLGRVLHISIPESSATWDYYYDTTTAACSGGAANGGNLTCSVDPNGNQTIYFYDSQNRLTDIGAGSSTICRRYRYDNTTGVLGTLPTGVTLANQYGRLAEAETDNCTWPITSATIITDEWRAYNAVGKPTSLWQSSPHSNGYYQANATFFENGLPQTVAFANPSSYTMTYTLEGEGRWKTIKDTTNNKSIVTNATFFPATSTPTISLTSTDKDVYTLDQYTGRITNYQFYVGSNNLNGAVTWNADGTLEKLVTTDGFNSGGGMTCLFNPTLAAGTGYDAWNRLVGFDCGTGNWGQTFAYGDTTAHSIYENLVKTKMANRSGTSTSYGYDLTTNHYSAGTGVSYDNNGNVTGDGTYVYGFDAFSKMKWVATSGTPTCGTSGRCITYDAFNRPVEYSNNSTWKELFYLQSGVADMSGTTINFAHFKAPMGGTVLANGSNSQRYYGHKNWLGTPLVWSNTQLNTVGADQSFSPFGETMTNFNSPTTPMVVFTGDN